ncbi:MAG: hypothetical protein H6Q25_506 [Bacteroidetes bacterium]|nr:hypothetical protein [Bacteroidota bacterium]
MTSPKLHIAIPAIQELEYLHFTLQDIAKQDFKGDFSVTICVNQPDEWWDDPDKVALCESNLQLIQYLEQFELFPITILDHSSKGKGWIGKKHGVGQARKTLFDSILKKADSEDILISLDADTRFGSCYFQSILERFTQNEVSVISVPYYHQLTDDDRANRAILRYELYMRNYMLNMYEIRSPYNFTAVGSAIACRIGALQKIGGITPMKSGEDFYLLQKFRKMGFVSNFNTEPVYPATRFSSRVYFGTGPAMIKGDTGDWNSYPIYHHSLFQQIRETYDLIPELYLKDLKTPFLTFLEEQYQESDLWTPLRKNFKTLPLFERGFHEKADGLRILQYLKATNQVVGFDDSASFWYNFSHFFPTVEVEFAKDRPQLEALKTEELAILRDLFFQKEMELRFSEKNG